MKTSYMTLDGNEAAATSAYQSSDVIAIYPITPSSPMGELADAWASTGAKNLWGTVPTVVEMQSEGGAAGAVHGALQGGAIATTFTASQGLLLMIPNMFKIAGELTPAVFHVAARSVASSALSIFGDHSDVMAARSTGFALLASASVQEALDLALIAQSATLRGRVPVVHFFDGFRTSHEVSKIEAIPGEAYRQLIDPDLVKAHRGRSLSPDRPVLRGSAMNPDVFFQAREASNPFYRDFPEVVEGEMARFAKVVGRSYGLFDYVGSPDATRVVVVMGSGAETCAETVRHLVSRGEKVGLVIVRLYRPFSADRFLAALPRSVRTIAVLDRTKEPGALGEPLFQEVLTCVAEAFSNGTAPWKTFPKVLGGRYGLSSKEFTPAMAARIFAELGSASPKPRFTVGIEDDVTHLSLDVREELDVIPPDVYQAVFLGLGADGTVSANKNTIKIIGESTDLFAQGYFVYDSKKAGSVTISHLRFGKSPIKAPYLIREADFVGCHQLQFLLQRDLVNYAKPGAVLLINAPHAPDELWRSLPAGIAREAIRKKLKVYVIDAYKVARETGLGARINTIMQTCFFKISGVIPLQQAIAEMKDAVKKTYGMKGDEIVTRNFAAIDKTLEGLQAVPLPAGVDSTLDFEPPVMAGAPDFVREFTAELIKGQGDLLPVSRIPCDGTFPTGTSRWEKRNIAQEIPVWDMETCIQCGKCVLVCPHSAIRMKAYEPSALEGCPETFLSTTARGKELDGLRFTLQTAAEDCTGCGICIHVCPAKNKRETRLKAIYMMPQAPLREKERANYDFFLKIPERDRRAIDMSSVRGSQFLEPLFEASGACAGCGETPYLRILTQLYGDRLLIANATGCSSIYGGNLPTTPWSSNREGRGPAWSNSLFEDNAEFGLGMRLAVDQLRDQAIGLVQELEPWLGPELVKELIHAPQVDEADLHEQRLRVAALRQKLDAHRKDERVLRLLEIADNLVEKTVWIVGGDGWAYDIGFGGLDHILASGRNVKVLVLDTEVYSNTGGQMSKSTPRAAVAKFAASGKTTAKKDLAMIAMAYRNVYVARVAFGANDGQTVKALIEAEQHKGPSIILAYSHCIAHGINMRTALDNHKAAVQSGHWPLCRYNPAWSAEGKSPLKLDSQKPKIPFSEYAAREARYTMLQKSHPETARRLLEEAQKDVDARWRLYEQLAESPGDIVAALAESKE